MDLPFISEINTQELNEYSTIEQILGFEGSLARKTYSNLCAKYGVSFKRDQSARNGINSALTLASNSLYNFTTSLILPLGLSPSVGFLHGQTRRGGLTFDIADVFKYPIFMEEIFSDFSHNCTKTLMRKMSKKLSDRRNFWTKEMVAFIQELTT